MYSDGASLAQLSRRGRPKGREMMISCGAVLFNVQPLELPWLRELIRTQLSDGACPHLVLRIGLVTQVAVSVRRDPPRRPRPGRAILPV